jgi:hypothetical protein
VGLNNLLIYRQTVVKLFWEFGCFYYYYPGSFLIPAFPDLTFLSEKGIRNNGHFHLEGKNYKVKDGDILNILFSV